MIAYLPVTGLPSFSLSKDLVLAPPSVLSVWRGSEVKTRNSVQFLPPPDQGTADRLSGVKCVVDDFQWMFTSIFLFGKTVKPDASRRCERFLLIQMCEL